MVAPMNVRVYVSCAAVLYAKYIVTTAIQSASAFPAGNRPPEDNRLTVAKGHPKQNYGLVQDVKDEKLAKANEVDIRWRRILLNDLESIPFALFVFAGGVMANANEKVFAGSMITYTVARCLHTIAYAKQKQPARAIVWFIGVSMITVGMVNAVVAAFS
ncbi:hypothetical protein Poli38472_001078 [Pythium oligandrum]|uniref:Microsomal glutathione S-transferase 1 n=1 Tax=Pythium oligandrum TaxID=41045 RepID=A0A8K1CU81_PYTOL|nr:hypothetical protein Poli38472_001078 [Pythium oligandrum]|eukprot:TMW68922.1 hypothetical protein Poli38472_001078 [Pythium oligandrum]